MVVVSVHHNRASGSIKNAKGQRFSDCVVFSGAHTWGVRLLRRKVVHSRRENQGVYKCGAKSAYNLLNIGVFMQS